MTLFTENQDDNVGDDVMVDMLKSISKLLDWNCSLHSEIARGLSREIPLKKASKQA